MEATMPVFNPALYDRMINVFGKVRVSRAGERRVDPDPDEGGRRRYGEQYVVRCPVCETSDLAVSYEYAQADRRNGRPMTHLAVCFGKRCMTVRANREALAQMLAADELADAPLRPVGMIPEVVFELPAGCTRLDELPKGHPARRYVLARRANPDTVGRVYGVSYGAEAEDRLARDRLVVPVYRRGKLRGWQGLAISEVPAGRQVLSARGMRTSDLVYNLDRAKAYDTGVLVSEPADVWAFGPMAVCALGSKISGTQIDVLKAVFRRKRLAVLMPKTHLARPDVQAAINQFRWATDGPLVVAERPTKTPDSSVRAYLRGLVGTAARESGADIAFKKVT